jgi:uncharacterized membrane protein YphA (DoxX/SURF4 family)
MNLLEKSFYLTGRFLIGCYFLLFGFMQALAFHLLQNPFAGIHIPYVKPIILVMSLWEIVFGFMLAFGIKQKVSTLMLLILTAVVILLFVFCGPIHSLETLKLHLNELLGDLLLFILLLVFYSHPHT